MGNLKSNKINIRLYQDLTKSSRVCLTPADTVELARELANQPVPNVWLLKGDLGSGKTTLVRGLLRGLGYRGPVTSPTFSLKHVFLLKRGRWRTVVHVDTYRLRQESEIPALEIVEAIAQPDHLVLIEWPERLGKIKLGRALLINIKHRPRGRLINIRIVNT